MAQPNLVQRGLQSLSQTVNALRTGEGESRAARLGRGERRGIGRAKAGLKNLRVALGFGTVDAFDDDLDEQRRQRRARAILGDDAPPVFVARDGTEHRDLNATVAPEFRAQVAAGLAAANTMTTGSTLVDGGGFDAGGEGESW